MWQSGAKEEAASVFLREKIEKERKRKKKREKEKERKRKKKKKRKDREREPLSSVCGQGWAGSASDGRDPFNI